MWRLKSSRLVKYSTCKSGCALMPGNPAFVFGTARTAVVSYDAPLIIRSTVLSTKAALSGVAAGRSCTIASGVTHCGMRVRSQTGRLPTSVLSGWIPALHPMQARMSFCSRCTAQTRREHFVATRGLREAGRAWAAGHRGRRALTFPGGPIKALGVEPVINGNEEEHKVHDERHH
jgi:hypothetical protein